ncbi:MAG: amidohydrolase, partial [Deltaproteobacteria bacterium]|nr:amidohydrolase [Deltaproteobacteria bacterium]MBI2229179.1 amidohydrolase [Deltaproteobacteria bacterium]MBI3064722.1 amidohydrolase [Deltaproteobacteria bacterium]
MVIDFQAHIFPRSYLDEMKLLDGAVILEAPDPYSGMSYFYDKKLKCRINTATFQGQNIERRLEHMDRLGVDIHVLTIPAPGADRFEGEDAVKIARVANDAIAEIARKHPKRFVGFFTLPTSNVKASLDELERSVNELGLKGFGCFANLNGQALDREELFPIYERLAKYKLPVYVHPTAPLATEATGIDIMPTLIFGWAFDSTVAMTRLVYGRVLEQFPEINFVVADVGGVLAFFAQRAINIYSGRTEEIRQRYGLKENPLDSFRRFYVDTADHPASTLRCVKDFFGTERMVLGTNYPYGPEEGCLLVKNSLKAIDGLELNTTEREKILGGNAARILGIGA